MYTLGLDIGSSSVKVALVDLTGVHQPVVARYPETEMKISSPYAGWAEQNPDDWWDYALIGIQMAVAASGINAREILSVGISYQMHGLVITDKKGMPLRPSIIWCDSRAVSSGNELAEKLGPEVISRKLLNHPGNFTASRLYWVKTHEKELFDRIHMVMLPGDYIAFRMSGTFSSTFSGLSEGIFYDFESGGLSGDTLRALGCSPDIFPHTGSCFDILCETNGEFVALTGIKKGTPVSYRAGDQPNNAFSLGVLSDEQAAATGGTSGVIYAVSDKVNYAADSGVNTFAHVNHTHSSPSYGTLLCINGAGILYNWIRHNLFDGHAYHLLENIAADTHSDGILFLPFGNGAERMLHNRILNGNISGLDFNRHDKAHILRAGLEGIAFAFAWGMEGMLKMGIQNRVLRTGNDNLFQSAVFSQTLADAAGVSIDVFQTTGAVGAARGSAFGAGLVSNMEDLFLGLSLVRQYHPSDRTTAPDIYAAWKQELISKSENSHV